MSETFYVTGGTLRSDAPSYVERQADRDLFEGLLAREYCYVLNTRQMGKSSLMVRTAARLREAGIQVAVLDLTAIGQNLSPEQWYEGLLVSLGQQLRLEDALDDFWLDHTGLGPLQRFMEALRQVVLSGVQVFRCSGVQGSETKGQGSVASSQGSETRDQRPETRDPNAQHLNTRTPEHPSLVLFIDEIDAVRSLPFSADEFFAGIRECYNRRTQDPCFEKLTFCLLGVATPADLIAETRMSPFNIGRRIRLSDFTPEEARPLLAGLKGGTGVLARILSWTGGQPYMTQRLCREAAAAGITRPQEVDALCQRLFLSKQARESDDHLAFIRNRLLRSEADLASLLDLYQQVRSGKPVLDDETNPLCAILKLSGVAREVNGRLAVRNRVYDRVFDREWVVEHMPDAEVRRQKAAFRRGLARASAVAGVVVAVMGGLAATALAQAARADRNAAWADRNAARADGEARKARRLATSLQVTLGREREARQKLEAALAEVGAQRNRANGEAARANQEATRANRQASAAGEARSRAEAAKRLAVEQQQVAEQKTEESRRSLVRLSVATGQRLADDGDLPNALLWFAEARRLEAGHRDRERIHALRFASYQQQAPALAHTWSWLESAPGVRCSIAELPSDVHVTPAGGLEYWDGRTDRVVRLSGPYAGREQPVWAGPDHKCVLTQEDGQTLRVREAGADRLVALHPRAAVALSHKAGEAPQWIASMSPDGQWVAFLDAKDDLHVWNHRLDRDTVVARIPVGELLALTFSPDGRTLLASQGKKQTDQPGRTLLWDLHRALTAPAVLQTGSAVNGTRFLPDGTVLLLASQGDTTVWDLYGPSGKGVSQEPPLTPRQRQTLPSGWTFDAAISPDGERVATVNSAGVARIWNSRTGQPLTPEITQPTPLFRVCFSPDGLQVATAGMDSTVRLWNTATGAPASPALSHAAAASQLGFSPDGRYLTVGNWNCPVRTWDLWAAEARDGRLLSGEAMGALAFSPNGQWVAGGARDGVARVWSAATGAPISPALAQGGQIRDVAFSPDCRQLLTTGHDGTARVWDLPSGQPAAPLAHGGVVVRARFTPDGRRIVTAGEEGKVRFWDAVTYRELGQPLQHPLGVKDLAFSPDGRFLLVGCGPPDLGRGAAYLWDLRSRRRRAVPVLEHVDVGVVSFSPDGRRFLTTGRAAQVWEAGSCWPVAPPFSFEDGALHAAFSPDGRRVATASYAGVARIWDAVTGKPLTRPLRHLGPVWSVQFSPDGRLLLTGSGDKTVRLWDTDTGEVVLSRRTTSANGQQTARFSPDGRRFALGGEGAWVWNVPVDRHTAEDAVTAARLLAVARIDPALQGTVVLEPQALNQAWRRLRLRYPEDHRVPGDLARMYDDRLESQAVDLYRTAPEGPSPESERRIDLVVSQNPGRARSWELLGHVDFRIGRREHALRDFSRAVELEPRNGPYWRFRGNVYNSLGRPEEALQDYTRALGLVPADPAIWMDRGNMAAELGRWGQAASDYEKAGALGAQPSWLSHYRSALAYLGAGNTEGYRKACMRYLDALAASEDTQALRFAAWTCALAPAAVPEPERLVTVAKKALTGKPEDYDLLQVYGAALYRAGRPAEAVAALEKADTGRPGNSIPLYSWFFLALAHHRLGHQEEAHRWLARARTEAGQVLSLKPDAAGAPPWNRRLTLRLLLAEADREIIPEGR